MNDPKYIFKLTIKSLLVAGLMISSLSFAHNNDGYSHDASLGANQVDWMSRLPDSVPLSDISLPGTHDTMAKNGSWDTGIIRDIYQTQSMTLETQLKSGIRVLDIRARHINNAFAIHHGSIYLKKNFDDVMKRVISFLKNNTTETVIIRFKKEYNDENISRTFAQTFIDYMTKNGNAYENYVWRPAGSNNPTLGQMRGKILFMIQDMPYHVIKTWGLSYPGSGNNTVFSIQDSYSVGTNWDLYDKWEKIKRHFSVANNRSANKIYINYLSASGGSSPYFVSSGHSSPSTGAPRLDTGLTTPGSNSSYPDFPRVNCLDLLVAKVCSIAFEGTNILTKNFLNRSSGYAGIVMADFPGRGLISAVINRNTFVTPSYTYTEITNKWKGCYLHNEYGNLFCGSIKPGWWSAQWRLDPINGTPYFRLKNKWKANEFIHIERGAVEVSSGDPGWHSSHWIVEKTTNGFARIKNRWKGCYLHNEYGNKLDCGSIKPGWWSAQWSTKIGHWEAPGSNQSTDFEVDRWLIKQKDLETKLNTVDFLEQFFQEANTLNVRLADGYWIKKIDLPENTDRIVVGSTINITSTATWATNFKGLFTFDRRVEYSFVYNGKTWDYMNQFGTRFLTSDPGLAFDKFISPQLTPTSGTAMMDGRWIENGPKKAKLVRLRENRLDAYIEGGIYTKVVELEVVNKRLLIKAAKYRIGEYSPTETDYQPASIALTPGDRGYGLFNVSLMLGVYETRTFKVDRFLTTQGDLTSKLNTIDFLEQFFQNEANTLNVRLFDSYWIERIDLPENTDRIVVGSTINITSTATWATNFKGLFTFDRRVEYSFVYNGKTWDVTKASGS